MKKISLILVAIACSFQAGACPVCGENQPKPLRGITHGAGPDSDWDYVIIGVMAAIVQLTLVFSIKWLVRPGERAENHIKRLILSPPSDAR